MLKKLPRLRKLPRLTALFCLLFALSPCGPLRAQDAAVPEDTVNAEAPAPPVTENRAAPVALPRNFREISLGMSLEELKAALAEDTLFSFRGDRDVSFLPAREESLVETTGLSFVKRAFFQLREKELFIMAFTLNTGLIDHYSVFTSLVEKYGEPDSLNPQQAVWETGTTRLALERPLTVKYIDMTVFNEIIGESATVESAEIRRRQEFIDAF